LIYSEEDKLKVLKDIIVNDLKLDEKQFKARQIAYYISEAKNSFLTAKDYGSVVDSYIKEKVMDAYKIYEVKMMENNALDFDDILFKTLQLLKNPNILEYYQEKYKYIMVDEYQDTNLVQYEIVKLLASKYRNLAVV
jgi:DNA helicase-2/ATP-dependent DNA helicase PcrA